MNGIPSKVPWYEEIRARTGPDFKAKILDIEEINRFLRRIHKHDDCGCRKLHTSGMFIKKPRPANRVTTFK